jgi:hypothetical protein
MATTTSGRAEKRDVFWAIFGLLAGILLTLVGTLVAEIMRERSDRCSTISTNIGRIHAAHLLIYDIKDARPDDLQRLLEGVFSSIPLFDDQTIKTLIDDDFDP